MYLISERIFNWRIFSVLNFFYDLCKNFDLNNYIIVYYLGEIDEIHMVDGTSKKEGKKKF